MKKIAILLTVFNRKEKTLTCLDSIFKLEKPSEISEPEVFLVDDGSTDGTPQAVQDCFPQVKVISGTGSLFWNRGMHLAWQTAVKAKDFDFFLWLNDDTFFYKNSLKVLLETSTAYLDKNIIVGTTCAVGNPQKITYGGRSDADGVIQPQNVPLECDYFNGNMVLIPQHVYSIVGMNDPFFRHALGDFDYGLRAVKSGITLTIAPSILGECDEHESLPVWCDPERPFSKRWKAFRSPLGQNPEEFFVFEQRHNGFAKACLHYLTNHIRVICPSIWNSRNKASLQALSENS